MSDDIDLRESIPADIAFLEELYPSAFPDEDLLPLARELLGGEAEVLSLVATHGGALVGHGAFTTCALKGRSERLALLGPLAVASEHQRRGVGGAIIRAGLRRLEERGARRVFVLGDPAYYARFDFEPEERVSPPYPLPDAWRGAWRSRALGGDETPFEGELSVPAPWRRRALWSA